MLGVTVPSGRGRAPDYRGAGWDRLTFDWMGGAPRHAEHFAAHTFLLSRKSAAARHNMADSTVKKVTEGAAPRGEMGQVYLASGKRVSMRLWNNEPPQSKKPAQRDYETVGYVISGRAELTVEQQTVKLEAGDSWLVPANSKHSYRILEKFTAVEATAPPAEVHGRDKS
jgi:quercetin dioxygenase-like cupin family protein